MKKIICIVFVLFMILSANLSSADEQRSKEKCYDVLTKIDTYLMKAVSADDPCIIYDEMKKVAPLFEETGKVCPEEYLEEILRSKGMTNWQEFIGYYSILVDQFQGICFISKMRTTASLQENTQSGLVSYINKGN